MLDKCGIQSTMQERKVKGGPTNRNKTFDQWEIRINGHQTIQLSKSLHNYSLINSVNILTGKPIMKYTAKRFSMAACTYSKIKSIKKIPYNGNVYNLEVEDDNSYIANMCSVHNCVMHVKEKQK